MSDSVVPLEDSSETKKQLRDFLGFVFLEILAAPPGYDGWQAIKAGNVKTALFFYGIASLPCLLGIAVLSGASARTRTRLSQWASRRIFPAALDVRYWMALFLVVFVYMATPVLLAQLKTLVTVPATTQSTNNSPFTKFGHEEGPDLRVAPFDSADFFAPFHADTSESFVMICFPYDPMSCNIAARYRDRLSNYWTPLQTIESPAAHDGMTIFDSSNPATFSGITIITQSIKRPLGALALRERLKSVGIDAGFPMNNPTQLKLGSNDFAIWIGGKP